MRNNLKNEYAANLAMQARAHGLHHVCSQASTATWATPAPQRNRTPVRLTLLQRVLRALGAV